MRGDPWEHVLIALGLGTARTVPITWLVPALGGPRVAPEVRIGLGVMLAVLCLPVLLPPIAGMATGAGVGTGPTATATATAAAASPLVALVALGPVGWIILVARELLVGLTVGLCASAVFRAAEAAGRLADILRGANLAEVLSPTADERTSPTGDLYLFVAVVLFLEMGGLRFLVGALARSYEAIPVGRGPAAAALGPAAALVTRATAMLLESAISLAAPVLVALWIADVALGVVGRAAPQIPLYFAAMPAKALLGLGVVLLGLGTLDAAWTAGFPAWVALIERAFAIWRPR